MSGYERKRGEEGFEPESVLGCVEEWFGVTENEYDGGGKHGCDIVDDGIGFEAKVRN